MLFILFISLFVLPIIGGIIIAIINICTGNNSNYEDVTGYRRYHKKHHNQHFMFWGDNSRKSSSNHTSAYSDPYDNHWETSFDWKDENNDGYDDRDDGFWGGQEF